MQDYKKYYSIISPFPSFKEIDYKVKKYIFILVLSGCSNIGVNNVNKPTITEFGIYKGVKAIGIKNLPQSNTGVLTFTDSPLLIEKTNKVPAIVGTTFGYCYDIPSNDQFVTITRKLINPPMLKPDGSTSKGYEYERTLDVKDGIAAYCTTYTLEYEWEAVIGVWKFSILLNGREIIKQEFELFK